MINEIYNQRILELAGNIPRLGRLANPDASAKAHSRLCGSTVVIDLCVKDGRVVDFAHDVKACALGQASSSLMARHVIGATAEELNELRDRMTRMLKANGPPPDGKWAEFAVLEPVRDYKARHASTLLTFDAVADALAQVAAREAARRPRRRRERAGCRAAPRRPRADPLLPAHAFEPHRPAMPVFADLFGLCGRGDRAPWPVGRLLDGRWRACAAATLGAAPATIRRPIGFPQTPHGRNPGAMDAGARATERALPLSLPAFMDWRRS